MASKEEINVRVENESEKAWDRFNDSPANETPRTAMVRTVRPLVERVVELEENNAELMRERLDLGIATKLAAAEKRVIELDRQVQTINADRSRAMADLAEARAELRTKVRELTERAAEDKRTIEELRASLQAEKLRPSPWLERVIEQDKRTIDGLRIMVGEVNDTADALRAQVAALTAAAAVHERAIRNARADVREECAAEIGALGAVVDGAERRIAALETTVDVLAGRLAQRGA